MARTNNLGVRQRGAALLLTMLVVLIAGTAVLVTRLNLNDARARQQTEAQDVLALARDALIDYAALRADFVPGEAARLPCPDLDGSGGLLEGVAHDAACGAPGETVMGRLPWRTLGIAPLKDSGDACLWYAVSGAYKDTAAAPMVNPDTNGQLQLHGIEAGEIIAGVQPQDRPVAMIIAPMRSMGSQSRAAPGTGDQCSSSFDAAQFLETDPVSGISNTSVSGVADAVDQFAATAGYQSAHNDRIATLSRADLAGVVAGRHDYRDNMRALGLAVTACIADHASKNPGGSSDRRMPWPAPLTLADYRPDGAYNDTSAGFLSGRLPDVVDDSNSNTGNANAAILTDCDAATVPAWTPTMFALWQDWKDHFFYAVAESYAPDASTPSACAACLSVNGAGQYAAVVLFSNPRLRSLAQLRNAPPIDVDTRGDSRNYLEGVNAANVPYMSGSVDFRSQPATATFNDLLFCIDDSLNVSEC